MCVCMLVCLNFWWRRVFAGMVLVGAPTLLCARVDAWLYVCMSLCLWFYLLFCIVENLCVCSFCPICLRTCAFVCLRACSRIRQHLSSVICVARSLQDWMTMLIIIEAKKLKGVFIAVYGRFECDRWGQGGFLNLCLCFIPVDVCWRVCFHAFKYVCPNARMVVYLCAVFLCCSCRCVFLRACLRVCLYRIPHYCNRLHVLLCSCSAGWAVCAYCFFFCAHCRMTKVMVIVVK